MEKTVCSLFALFTAVESARHDACVRRSRGVYRLRWAPEGLHILVR